MSDQAPLSSGISANEVRANAAMWLVERDGPDWTAAKQAELETWLSESTINRIAYLKLEATWLRADRLAALRPVRLRKSILIATLIRISAGIAILAIFAFAASQWRAAPVTQMFATAVGERKTILLGDGSQIELNTDTTLRFTASEDARSAVLEKGEAYFQIHHDAARPFVVNVGTGRVTDLGTKFTVRRDPGKVSVALIEGKARYDALNGAIRGQFAELKPGDSIIATASIISKAHLFGKTLQGDLSWRQGILTFDNKTLAEVAATFNRYNRQKLVIAGADVARLTVVGTFRTDGVARFARVAREILGLQVTHHGDEIIVSR